jgi:hypothetical protein
MIGSRHPNLIVCFLDCNRIIYQHSISIQPFRPCDERNFGMSELCNFENENPNPQIWGQQVLSQLNSSQLQTRISSQRFLNPRLFNSTIFENMKREYDAFEKDIAGVNFTNVLRAAFSYESFLPCFFVLIF